MVMKLVIIFDPRIIFIVCKICTFLISLMIIISQKSDQNFAEDYPKDSTCLKFGRFCHSCNMVKVSIDSGVVEKAIFRFSYITDTSIIDLLLKMCTVRSKINQIMILKLCGLVYRQ